MIQELRILDDETLFDKEVHYVIPRYQRAYAWEDKEIVQLIDDINDSTGDYYIGSLVVAKVKGKEETYEVVDGQQRLTTLYLLLEQSILNGLKVIEQKFTVGDVIDVEAFIERLKSVILYRIEVPEHTDLNRYFEIMNTRGEQLEQHDILKAQLMRYLSNRREQEFFSRVWNACSDMTGYVQMHFAKAEREEIFGDKWSPDKLSGSWSRYTGCLKMGQSADEGFSITSVTRSDFKVAALDAVRESDNTPIRFDSIIGFPHFLLHVLRVFLRV